jgi:hypothetical protein
MILHIQGIPEGLQRQFKIVCLQKGMTMKEAVTKFMREEVEKAQKGKS